MSLHTQWNDFTPKEWTERIRSALQLSIPYEERSHREMPDSRVSEAVPAAVLLLLDLESKDLLFIRRAESGDRHSGQMAFPGGRAEPVDSGDPVRTAIRETEEEVGVSSSVFQTLGSLPSLITVTGYRIDPVVGVLKVPKSEVVLKLDPLEIAGAVWISLEGLTRPGTYRKESLIAGLQTYPIHVYQVDSHRIWGATAAMAKNFLDRLEALS